ncbi:hypothetical protein GCM10010392_61140 [Streptomyces clavifer]|nr:hypothetical protein GCM10010392_61140 [Streptomyces clavifer]
MSRAAGPTPNGSDGLRTTLGGAPAAVGTPARRGTWSSPCRPAPLNSITMVRVRRLTKARVSRDGQFTSIVSYEEKTLRATAAGPRSDASRSCRESPFEGP